MKGIDRFMIDLKKQCKQHGIRLYLPKTKNVKFNSKDFSSGYFDEETLACATARKDYITTLIHESCHLDQYLEKSKLWEACTDNEFDDWLAGRYVENPEKHIDAYKWLELDCEKRSVKKFKKYGIPFNESEYIQKANAYVQFYNYMKYSRRWCSKKNTPYTNKNVWGEMPKVFVRKSWYKAISEYGLRLFIRNKI